MATCTRIRPGPPAAAPHRPRAGPFALRLFVIFRAASIPRGSHSRLRHQKPALSRVGHQHQQHADDDGEQGLQIPGSHGCNRRCDRTWQPESPSCAPAQASQAKRNAPARYRLKQATSPSKAPPGHGVLAGLSRAARPLLRRSGGGAAGRGLVMVVMMVVGRARRGGGALGKHRAGQQQRANDRDDGNKLLEHRNLHYYK